MTTFILHGGNTSKESPSNQDFYKTFTSMVDKPKVKIVACYWARTKNRWQSTYEKDLTKIKEQTNKEFALEIAQDPEDLRKKLKTSDVLYVAGGSGELIEPEFLKLTDLKELLEGKVYIGSSMGAFLVSQGYMYSFDRQEWQEVKPGLGLLDITTLCHWNIEARKEFKLEKLAEKFTDYPTLCIDEGKYSILYN